MATGSRTTATGGSTATARGSRATGCTMTATGDTTRRHDDGDAWRRAARQRQWAAGQQAARRWCWEGTTIAKLIAPAPRASGSASIAMGGMTTHIPFELSRQALHVYTFILTYFKFLWKYQFWRSVLNLVKMAATVTKFYFNEACGGYTHCAWAGGTCAKYPDFFKNHQFNVIYCVTLAYVLFQEFLVHIHIVDS